ncbi:hypothetical protein FJK98_02380 [Micromonospora sp. HM134]|uniref:hypothetical protein n=1 Tax=Micromonospora sp. HM134 TaxID=2583243 RepID=UPI001198A548|nr:hypothetical protein [Micromonospora sp. HM134]QDY06152.1 hypothetical protein FJK98_02380 [Micromonospora sp. HM134]
MTHPHQLHATRAAGSLNTARTHLDNAVTAEANARRAEARTIAAAGAIQAWRPMPGPSGQGGHGDLVGRTAVSTLEPEFRDGRLARLTTSTTATLTWLADNLDGRSTEASFGMDPLARIQALTTRLRPSTARHLTLWLDEADTRIRDTLHLDPAGQALTGIRCPRCARRKLTAHTTGPRTTWTVTCTTTCLCTGPNCPCTMPTRVADIPHIWGPDHPLTATA